VTAPPRGRRLPQRPAQLASPERHCQRCCSESCSVGEEERTCRHRRTSARHVPPANAADKWQRVPVSAETVVAKTTAQLSPTHAYLTPVAGVEGLAGASFNVKPATCRPRAARPWLSPLLSVSAFETPGIAIECVSHGKVRRTCWSRRCPFTAPWLMGAAVQFPAPLQAEDN